VLSTDRKETSKALSTPFPTWRSRLATSLVNAGEAQAFVEF